MNERKYQLFLITGLVKFTIQVVTFLSNSRLITVIEICYNKRKLPS